MKFTAARGRCPARRERKRRRRCCPLLEAGGIPVVTGYIAATAKGIPTTLGRGGSDYSATILGAALDASEVIIWTDVNGVLTADPRMVPDAVTLDEVSYTEAGELAFFGAKVLHPMTLRPVIESAIPVWIRNSFQPQQAGTKITHTVRPAPQGVKAVTATRDVAMIAVAGPGIIGVPDIAARIFARDRVGARKHRDDFAIVLAGQHLLRGAGRRRRAHGRRRCGMRLYEDVHQHDLEHIKVNRNVAIVAAVGENMAGTPGIAGPRLQHAGQGSDQHHRHRARLVRIQHFFPRGIGRNGKSREGAAPGVRPGPAGKRRRRADRRSNHILKSS